MWIFEGRILKIVDGDTLDVELDLSSRELDLGFSIYMKPPPIMHHQRIRLKGIDTPEVRGDDKVRGFAAKVFVEQLCPVGTKVRVETKKRGKYGRYLGDIYVLVDGQSIHLNEALVANDHAVRMN